MSRMLYDFECPEGHTFEELIETNSRCLVVCPQHKRIAKKLIPAPRIDRSAIALSASASPESIAHFDRVHRERRAIEEKSLADHGDYGKSAGSD